MKKIFCILSLLFITHQAKSWGFFAHKLINHIAVFSLPSEMFLFYKTNIEFITEHAVSADKRRYTDTNEAHKHYIDLDHYEKVLPIDTVPKYWKDAVLKLSADTLRAYGIVPWHINVMMYRLSDAFKTKNLDLILKYSADIGHYIADAHVPLHASENYNGQFTAQNGIHAFWEGRLPELFCNKYDLFVGKSVYINDMQSAAWAASKGSFAALDSVLSFEKKLNLNYSADKKYSYEQRGSKQIKIYSKDYSDAYHRMLSGQVERRMRASIFLIACAWHTAWINAGQPDLNDLTTTKNQTENSKEIDRKKLVEEEQKMMFEKMIGRDE